MGNKLINVATTEAHPPLGNALRKIGRAWHSLADLGHAQAISESVVVGDSLGYQGMNARSAKETLLMRTGVLEEYQGAVKTTISKRRQIERLKASSNIRSERVDDAIEDMEEVNSFVHHALQAFPTDPFQANRYEQVLAKRAEGISQNLHKALQTHDRYVHDDVTTALIEHARSSIMYERQLLRELEALRVDVSNAAQKVVAGPASIPKPTIIPPLEDFSVRPPPLPRSNPPASAHNGVQRPSDLRSPPLPPTEGPPQLNPQVSPSPVSPPSKSFSEPLLASRHDPLSSTPIQGAVAGPSSLAPTQRRFAQPIDEPPLGGRFVDGSKSMFIKPTQPPHAPPLAASSSTTFTPRPQRDDPLQAGPVSRPTYDPSASMIGQASHGGNGIDPLGHIQYQNMSHSVRVQPTRPRLDPREAASKLANMF